MTSTLPPLVQAFSGAFGSAFANGLSYPLDLVTTRLQLDSPRKSQHRGGVSGGIRLLLSIIKRHGVGALYDGLVADTYATLLSNFFYFYFYSFIRQLSVNNSIPFNRPNAHSSKRPHKPTWIEELFLGFIAGVASRAISTPLNIITLRIQTERADYDEDSDDEEILPGSPTKSSKYGGIIGTVKLIYKEQGLVGFWRGFQMSALLSLNPSITMAFLQMYRRVLGLLKSSAVFSANQLSAEAKHRIVNHNLSPREAFLGAAISNSIAVSILYPLILGKKRLQASSSTTMQQVLIDAYRGKDIESHRPTTTGLEKAYPDSTTKYGSGGIPGLYQGYRLKIISGFLSQGVTFLVKGRIEQLIIAAYLARLKKAGT